MTQVYNCYKIPIKICVTRMNGNRLVTNYYRLMITVFLIIPSIICIVLIIMIRGTRYLYRSYMQHSEPRVIFHLPLHSSYSEVMTGLTDRAEEGNYIWVDTGEKAEYIAWAVGDPNGIPGDGDCSRLRFLANESNTWLMADGDCDTAYNFICKMPLERGMCYIFKNNLRNFCWIIFCRLLDVSLKKIGKN